MDINERYAWIQLALTPYIGAESFLRLWQHFGSAQAALAASAYEVAALVHHSKQVTETWEDRDKARIATDAALQWEQQADCRLLLLCDDDYPMILNEGLTPPPLLFLRGDVQYLQRPAVSIVGSRHATARAKHIAYDFAYELSQQGITIISGMATGIDTAAHCGALEGIGSTIAVWGTGIDRVYPASNQALARTIAEKGLIVSEFPLGTKPLASHFPRRNRIIAAQSLVTLVVEAALESGSLITARQAAEMGRDVMAIPGSIDNPHSKGCHKLIKEGAKLVENIDDILHECPDLLKNSFNNKPLFQFSKKTEATSSLAMMQYIHAAQNNQTVSEAPQDESEHSLLKCMGYEPIHPDVLAENSHLSTVDVYTQLLELELEGKVAAMAGGRFQRIK